MKSNHKGIKRIIKAFGYSFDGFKSTFKSEAAFRQDLLFCAVALAISLLLPITAMAKLAVFSSLVLILLMELVNTAIEAVVDLVSPNYHDLAKKAKDIGSLLVLLSFVNAIAVFVAALV